METSPKHLYVSNKERIINQSNQMFEKVTVGNSPMILKLSVQNDYL